MKKCLLVLTVVCLVFAGGCWDKCEINDLAFVVAAGADLVKENGQERVRLTLQIANPIALIPGQGGGGGSGNIKAFWTIAGEGRSVREASVSMLARIPKKLFYGQTRVYIIGEDAAKSGVVPLLDRSLRGRSTRRNMYLAIARGTAKDVLELEMPTFRATGMALSSMFDLHRGAHAMFPVTLNDFAYRLSTGSTCPIAPVVSVVPQTSVSSEDLKTPGKTPKAIQINGIAVFNNNGQLLGYLDREEIWGLMWVLGVVKEREIVIPCSDSDKNTVTLSVARCDTSIVSENKKTGIPAFRVKVRTICDLSENFGSERGTMTPQDLRKLESLANGCIRKEILSALNQAQAWKADVFGFGEEMKRQDPDAWREVAHNWEEVFPAVKIKLEIQTALRHRGLTVESPAKSEGE